MDDSKIESELMELLTNRLRQSTLVVQDKKVIYKGSWADCINYCSNWMNQRYVDWQYESINDHFEVLIIADMPKAAKILYGVEDGEV